AVGAHAGSPSPHVPTMRARNLNILHESSQGGTSGKAGILRRMDKVPFGAIKCLVPEVPATSSPRPSPEGRGGRSRPARLPPPPMLRITVPLTSLAILLAANFGLADDRPKGEQIYAQQCARCHGTAGEGVKEEYAKPLIGDRPLDDLARVIAETMPEDHPETCVGED